MIYLRKETFGSNIHSDHMSGVSIFPVKMKTHEAESQEWFEGAARRNAQRSVSMCTSSSRCVPTPRGRCRAISRPSPPRAVVGSLERPPVIGRKDLGMSSFKTPLLQEI